MSQAQRRGFSRVNEIAIQVVGSPGNIGTGAAAGVMTGTAVITSDRVLASGATSSLSFQNKWTGTPSGAFTYQGSNDLDPDSAPVVGWITVTPDVAPTNPAGAFPAAGGGAAVFKNPPLRWYQQLYTNSASSGVLSTMAEAKGV